VRQILNFDVLLTVYLNIFILVVNQLDAQNLFTISLLHASTCFEHHVAVPCTGRPPIGVMIPEAV